MTTKKVTLPTPILRGETEITEIELFEPSMAALQGLEISSVVRGDVAQLMILLPKISDLNDAEVRKLSFKNITALSLAVTGFLG